MDLFNREAMHLIAQNLLLGASGNPGFGLEPCRSFRSDLETLQVDQVEAHYGKASREYVESERLENPCVMRAARGLSGFDGTEFAVQLIECQGGVAAGRVGPFVGDIADAGSGHADFLSDVGELQSRRLQIPDALCPCIHRAEITGSRRQCQRHTVTVSRQTCNMTLGKRIKDRLKELGRDVKWLVGQTGIPPSTLYDIMNGGMKSSTKLPLIAAKLGLRAIWLQNETGPRLVTENDGSPDKSWRFSFAPKRIADLRDHEFAMIDAAVKGMLDAIDKGDDAPIKKAAR